MATILKPSAEVTGFIKMWTKATVPSNFLLCDGSAISRTSFANLFAVVGIQYGNGDGSTTFNLPDLRGRSPIGDGTGVGLTPRAIGDAMGEEFHQLVTGELPSHDHAAGAMVTDSTDLPHKHNTNAESDPAHQPFGNWNSSGIPGQIAFNSGYANSPLAQKTDSPDTSLDHIHNVTGNTATTGTDAAHNNMQPSTVVRYVIRF